VKAQLGSKTHWQESNDLEMMFEGTYTSDFYRAIRDLLHAQISLQTREATTPTPEQRRARRALERNWRELLARERQYRSQRGDTQAAL
jgi:anaerobic magnesium-protoporphyrin IX monomethyl ester cyclase